MPAIEHQKLGHVEAHLDNLLDVLVQVDELHASAAQDAADAKAARAEAVTAPDGPASGD